MEKPKTKNWLVMKRIANNDKPICQTKYNLTTNQRNRTLSNEFMFGQNRESEKKKTKKKRNYWLTDRYCEWNKEKKSHSFFSSLPCNKLRFNVFLMIWNKNKHEFFTENSQRTAPSHHTKLIWNVEITDKKCFCFFLDSEIRRTRLYTMHIFKYRELHTLCVALKNFWSLIFIRSV